MSDLYRQFLMEPSARRFLAVLDAFELPADAAIPSLESLDLALTEGRYQTLRTLTRQWSRYFALSVHFHRLASIAALEIGDVEDAELERFTSEACLEGVLNSGDGSADRPYRIAHRADAQEVLAKLKTKPDRQKRVQTPAGFFDVFEVPSANADREVWFSVHQGGLAQAALAKTPQKRAKKVAV